MQQVDSLLEQVPAFAQIGRRFRLQNQLNFLRDFIDALAPQRHGHAAARTHRVDGDGEFCFLSVNHRFLEEKSFAATRRFHFPVSPFGDEQVGVDRDGNAFQLARLLQRVEELSKRPVSHRCGMATLDGSLVERDRFFESTSRSSPRYQVLV